MLDDPDRLEFYDAIFKFMFDGEDPNFTGIKQMAWTLIKPNLTKSKIRSKAGSTNQTESKKIKRDQNESNEIGPLLGEGEGKGEGEYNARAHLVSVGADGHFISDWFKIRAKKKAVNSETAMNGFLSQVEKSGRDINEVLQKCCEESWAGFKASWEWEDNNDNGSSFFNADGSSKMVAL